MVTSQKIRAKIETELAGRIPSALTPIKRLVRPTIPCGIGEIDRLLNGGFALGAISEVTGPRCSGRTTLALSLASAVTRSGNVSAWIDASDALDPASAAANGVDLDRMLWVRCGLKRVARTAQSGTIANTDHEQSEAMPRVPYRGPGSPHPRHEVRGLDTAVSELLRAHALPRKQQPGTPGAVNLPLHKVAREEQVSHDRMSTRRRPSSRFMATTSYRPVRRGTETTIHPVTQWERLEQAIRTADLLVNHGGFQLIVFDMGDIEASTAVRIPMATWFRFRAAAEMHPCCFLVLSQCGCAKSSAALSMTLAPAHACEDVTVMTGLSCTAGIARQRFEPQGQTRKSPQRETRAQWTSHMSWAG